MAYLNKKTLYRLMGGDFSSNQTQTLDEFLSKVKVNSDAALLIQEWKKGGISGDTTIRSLLGTKTFYGILNESLRTINSVFRIEGHNSVSNTFNDFVEPKLLGQGNEGSFIDQEIQIETFGLDLTFSEETDYELPLTKQVTTNFKGISHESESIAIGEGEFKVVSKSLLGLIDASFITTVFGQLFPVFLNEEEDEDTFFKTLFSGKLTLDYKIHDIYENDILFVKMVSLSLNGGIAYNLSPGSKFEIAYRYIVPDTIFETDPHEIKFNVQENFFSFSETPITSDFPIIERFTISDEGEIKFLNPIIMLGNLPSENDVVTGQLYEDENGFVRVKGNPII